MLLLFSLPLIFLLWNSYELWFVALLDDQIASSMRAALLDFGRRVFVDAPPHRNLVASLASLQCLVGANVADDVDAACAVYDDKSR